MKMVDFIDRFNGQYGEFAAKLRSQHVYGDASVMESEALGAEITIAGISKPVINCNWLDYLALGNYAPVKDFAKQCNERYGTGTISSRVLMDSAVHQEFESCLADFKDSEGCVVMGTGFSASNSLVSLLANEMVVAGNRMRHKPKSLLFADKMSHASIQSALLPFRHGKNKHTEVFIYNHLDHVGLYDFMNETRNETANRFIVTDSLFSMNGSFADIPSLLKLAKEFSAFIVLDNAHCDGIYGEEGKGILSMQNIAEEDRKYFLETGTFSKTLASVGGYMAMPEPLCDLARVSEWKYIFSAALPTASVASLINVLRIIRGPEGERRRKILLENSSFLLGELKKNEFNTLNSTSHVIPIVIGSGQTCLEAHQNLLHNDNIMFGPIRFPAVEQGCALLRLTLTADHTREHAEKIVSSLVRARDKFKF